MRGRGKIAADPAGARLRHALIVRDAAGSAYAPLPGAIAQTLPFRASAEGVQRCSLRRAADETALGGVHLPMRRIGSLPAQFRAVSRMCAKNLPFGPLTSDTSTTVPGCVSVAK